MHGLRRRRILDQLDQVVAVDHLARRDRDIAADLEGLGTDRRLAGKQALHVFQPVTCAAQKVEAALLRGTAQDHRIQPRQVGRCEHVHQLAHHEADLGFMMARQARHLSGRLQPPGLGEQMALHDRVERPFRPRAVGKALVAGRGFRGRIMRRARSGPRQPQAEPRQHRGGPQRQGELLPGRRHQMHRPIRPGTADRNRRHALRQPCLDGPQHPVGGAETWQIGGRAVLSTPLRRVVDGAARSPAAASAGGAGSAGGRARTGLRSRFMAFGRPDIGPSRSARLAAGARRLRHRFHHHTDGLR